MSRRLYFLVALLSSLSVSSLTSAQVPQKLSYQGLVTESDGSPVKDGSYQVVFRLYEDISGGEALWHETQTLAVDDGLFGTAIGSTEELTVPFDRQYYLTIQVEGQAESDRMPLTSAPYSLVAGAVAPGAAVRSVSGLTDDVEIVAGEGIAIRKEENRLVISAGVGITPVTGSPARKLPLLADYLTPLPDADEADEIDTESSDLLPRDAASVEFAVMGPGGSNTGLDAAYDAGNVITADAGIVDIVRPTAANNVVARVFKGDLQVRNTVSAQLQLMMSNNSLTQTWMLRTLSNNGAFALYDDVASKTPLQVLRNSANNLVKLTGNSVQIQGNVGVSAGAPKAKLHVKGTSWFQGDTTPLPGSAGRGIAIGFPAAVSYGYIFAYDYGTPSARNLALNHTGGNVGIGTTSPAARLHVAGGSTTGVFSTSTYTALYGSSQASSGVYGTSSFGYGVEGFSGSSIGVFGTSAAGSSAGMYGTSPYVGVQGVATGGDGGRQAIRGENFGSQSGYAGFFNGNVWVYGTLFKNAGSFRIDHPLDPENKYLSHSFVESPDMMNIYNGNVVLDGRGEAVVRLPEWFEALNRDFRYQLTAVGGPGPNLYVAEKISDNRFAIAGGTPGLEVSWQVTGIRHDAYAQQNRIQVEEMKPVEDRGRYLNPAAFGQSNDRKVSILQGIPAPAEGARTHPRGDEQ